MYGVLTCHVHLLEDDLHTYILAHLLEEDAALLVEECLHRGEALREYELVGHHHLHHEGVVRLRGGG